ncbi:MAG: hypothetical protein SOR61_06235 [Evtepia sp.]|nr:hypothetical protein [Evtepia sp.]
MGKTVWKNGKSEGEELSFSRRGPENVEKIRKNMKKVLDIWGEGWYYTQAVANDRREKLEKIK